MQFTIKFTFVFAAHRANDGCYVNVNELKNGLLELTLRSNHRYDEIVDQKIIDKAALAATLDGWADY